MSFEQITLIGNLGRDAELRSTPSGKAVADFSLATTDWNGETRWWKVTIWQKLAESVTQYLTKGKQVMVQGTMTAAQPETYVNNAGETVAGNYAVTAQTLKLLGSKGDNAERVPPPEPGSQAEAAAKQDEIPF